MINGNSIMQTIKQFHFPTPITMAQGTRTKIPFEIYFNDVLFCFAFFPPPFGCGEHPGTRQKNAQFEYRNPSTMNSTGGSFFLSVLF